VARRIDFETGSLALLLTRECQAPLLTANILTVVLMRMLAEGLPRLLAPGGCLVLSGILAEQSAGLEEALQEKGLKLEEKRTREDWVALVARCKE
jgi:ribosomal protein L11 methyltransferase